MKPPQRLPLTLPIILVTLLTLLALLPLHPRQALSVLTALPPACPLLHLRLHPTPSVCCGQSTFCAPLKSNSTKLANLLPLIPTSSHFNFLLLPPHNSTYVCHSRLVQRLMDYEPTTPLYAYIPTDPLPFSNILTTEANPPNISDSLLVLSRAALPVLLKHAAPPSYRTMAKKLAKSGALPVPLRAFRRNEDCNIQNKVIVMTGLSANHTACATANAAECDQIPDVPKVSAQDVSFLIVAGGVKGRLDDVVKTIRKAYPKNEIIAGDLSGKKVRGVRGLPVKSVKGWKGPTVRNALVNAANGKIVCFLTDLMRLSWETELGLMLRRLAERDVNVVGGRVLRNGGYAGKVGSVGGGSGVGYRYGFGNEWVLRRETIGAAQFEGRGCFRAHRPSEFFCGWREGGVGDRWKWRGEFGEWAEDEMWIRMMRTEGRVAVCDSGVRERWYDSVQLDGGRDWDEQEWKRVLADVKKVCGAWEMELGDIGGLQGRVVEVHCMEKRVCRRKEKVGGNGTEFENEWACKGWK